MARKAAPRCRPSRKMETNINRTMLRFQARKPVVLELQSEAQVVQPEGILWPSRACNTSKSRWALMKTTSEALLSQETLLKLGTTPIKCRLMDFQDQARRVESRAQERARRTHSHPQAKVNKEPLLPNRTKRFTKASLSAKETK